VSISDTGVLATDADHTVNDIADVASAVQGGTVTFTNIVNNGGNGIDSFNIAVGANNFPAGTAFALLKSDGVTPLIDTNGDGIPDSGPLAAGANYTVIVKATLPAGATGGSYTATVKATSTAVGVINAGASDTVTEQLDTITANTVDLTNNAALGGSGVLGTGAGPEGSAVVTSATNPGTTTTFTLYVNNSSTVADSFDLVASNTTTFATSNTLPTGWTVTFRSSNGVDCSTANLGTAITNSGVVNAAGNKLVCAVVSVPAQYAAGTVAMYFQSKSPTSGALDAIHDAVTVNVLRAVTVTPNNSGQIFPNGSVVYTHVLANNGNVTEAVSFAGSFIADSLGSGWASVLYQDNGGTVGSLDATDATVTTSTTFNLTPGQKVTLFVKVAAPAGAAIGAQDASTATATYTYLGAALTTSSQDSTTVIAGELRLLKEQALDANCDGTPDTAFGQADIGAGAVPGACVIYRITATNQGTANVTSVVVSDATPAYTVYFEPSAGTAANSSVTGSGVTITKPTSGIAGTVSVNLGITQLAPNASEVLTFVVKISQ
jgi:uncharacterized repeat protein (TIGR01451 family)